MLVSDPHHLIADVEVISDQTQDSAALAQQLNTLRAYIDSQAHTIQRWLASTVKSSSHILDEQGHTRSSNIAIFDSTLASVELLSVPRLWGKEYVGIYNLSALKESLITATQMSERNATRFIRSGQTNIHHTDRYAMFVVSPVASDFFIPQGGTHLQLMANSDLLTTSNIVVGSGALVNRDWQVIGHVWTPRKAVITITDSDAERWTGMIHVAHEFHQVARTYNVNLKYGPLPLLRGAALYYQDIADYADSILTITDLVA